MALLPRNNRNMELLRDQRRARKKMYRRKMNIFKKAEELSILCGIDVAVILFQPADKSTTAPPAVETWPKDPTEIKRIIRRYQAKSSCSHASSSNISLPAIKDPSSSSSSPSPSVLGKRNCLNLDLSLSGLYDSRMKILKDDRGKKKLHYEFHTNWNVAVENEMYNDNNELRIGYHDHEAKLASLEAKREAITKRIASLEG
ncbi:hypothetical protein ACLB2K_073308 [Fragaria x ananassa]